MALLLLHTPVGRRAVKSFVETTVSRSVAGELRFGDLRYSLFGGRLDAARVRLAMEGTTIDLGEASLRWSPRGGLRLRLVRPSVVVRDTGRVEPAADAVGYAARPWAALEHFQEAELVDGRVELQDAAGVRYLVLGSLNARMREREGRRRIGLAVRDGVVGPLQRELSPIVGEADMTVADGRLAFDRVHLETRGSTVDLQGILERLSPNRGELHLRADGDGALAALVAPQTKVTGRIRAQARLVAGNTMSGTLRIAAPALTVQEIGPWDASLRGRFDSSHLVIEWAEALGYGGRFTVKGPVALADHSKTDLVLEAEDVDLAALARAATQSEVPLRSRLHGQVRYTLQGWDVNHGRAEGELRLSPLPALPPTRRRGTVGVPVSGKTRLLVEGRQVRLRELRLEAHNALVVGDLTVSPDLHIDGRYRAELPLASTPALLGDLGIEPPAAKLVGRLSAEGALGGEAKNPVATLRLRGEGLATEATASSASARIDGEARYQNARLEIRSLVVSSSGGGQATFSGTIPLAPRAGRFDVSGRVEALDLGPMLAMAGVDGRGPMNGRLRIEGPQARPAVHAELDARLALPGSAEPVVLSLAGSGTRAGVTVERLSATLAGGRLEGSGSFDARTEAIQARAKADGLHVARLPLLPASARRLDGVAAAQLSLAGTVKAPVGELTGSVSQATLDGGAVPGLRLTARADGRRLELRGSTGPADATSVQAAPSGSDPAGDQEFLRGSGSLEGDWPLRLEIDASAVPVQALLDAMPATRGHGAAASVRGRVRLDVPLRAPRALRYSSDDLIASGRVRDVEWSTQTFAVEGDTDEATVRGLRVSATSRVPSLRPRDAETTGPMVNAGGTLALDGRVPLAPGGAFDLAVQAGVDLGVVQALLPDQRVAGTAKLDVRVRGTATDPDVRGEATIADMRGRFGPARVNSVQALARFQGDHVSVDRLDGRLLGGRIAAAGALPLRSLSGRAPARLHFEATDVDLSRIQTPGPQQDPDAPAFLVSVTGDVEATAPAADAIRARGRFTRLEQRSPEGTIALQSPAEWTLDNGRFVQSPLRLAGPLGTLEARAEARLAGGPSGGSAAVAGPFDLRMLNPFVQDTTLSGPARIDLRASWNPQGVRLQGGLSVEGGRMTLEELAFTATGMTGEVRLLGERATVEASAVSADGRIGVEGGMTFGPRLLGPGELRIRAERVPIAYPEGFRGRASGTIRVAGDADGYRVEGEIGLAEAFYTAEFSQQKQSLDRLDWQLAALRGSEALTESLPLAVTIRLEDRLRIRNSQAQLDVTGTINAGGTMAQPVATGQVTLLEGGQLTIRRARIRAQGGRVELNGYPAGVPGVDFSGLTQVAGIEMELRASGSMEDLQLDISSPNRPDLSQTDLVSLLLTGRTAQAFTSDSRAFVTEELASALGGVLQKGIGETLLVDVGPERSLLADGNDPTQRFNVGTRLRQDLIVMYSTRLDGTEQRWIVDSNPRGGRLRLRAISEETQGLSFELTDRHSFNVLGGRAPTRPKQENPKIVALRFEGELPLPEKELRKAAKIKLGRRYDALRREQSADHVRALLVKTGWRSAAVDATSHVAPGHQQSLELVLRVDAGPRVLLSWTGDDPGKDIREAARNAWPAYASPEAASSAVARAARIGLRAAGYYRAKVAYAVRVADGRAELALTVERGPLGAGVDVEFDGNAALSDEQLLAVLPQPGSSAFFEALERRSNRLTGEIRLAYARAGHLRVRVRPPREQFDAATGRLKVTVPVREREASTVTQVVLPQEVVEAGGKGPTLSLEPGRRFDVTGYLADRDAIAAWYRREGWMEARVRAVLEPTGSDLVVRYAAEPGPRTHANQVRIATDGRPRPQLLRRSVAIEPGELITPSELGSSRARLSELAIFRSVDVRPVPVAGRSDVSDLVVSYVERPDLDVEYGIRYTPGGSASVGGTHSTPDSGRLQLAGAVELSDPFGWGWRIRPYTFLMRERYTWGTTLESATLFGLRVRTQFHVFDDQDSRARDVATLASRVRGFSVQQTRTLLRDTASESRWHDRLRLQWGYANKDIEYGGLTVGSLTGIELPPEVGPGGPLGELGASDRLAGNRAFASVSLIGDERDSFTDPRRGTFWTATAELSRRALGSDVNYVRLYGQGFVYLPLPLGIVWAQGYRAGVVPGTDPLLLLENRFQAGGPSTVRGFEQNDLGPQLGEEGLGGQAVAIFNQELRFPIARPRLPVLGELPVAGGLFWDAGNVWGLSREFSLSGLRQSVGVGLRFMFPFGPLRIEYAFVVNRRRDADGTYRDPFGRLVFGLGHAF